jgi:hypothetical protein
MRIRTQFLMFSISGSIGLLVDLSALYVASMFMNLYSARIVSFVAAVFSTWLLNRTLTFKVIDSIEPADIEKTNSLLYEFFKYLIANLSGGLVNLIVYSIYVSYNIEITDKYIATCLGSLSGLLLNFALSKFIVFRR